MASEVMVSPSLSTASLEATPETRIEPSSCFSTFSKATKKEAFRFISILLGGVVG